MSLVFFNVVRALKRLYTPAVLSVLLTASLNKQ
jgi:hypothetical protein